jgi:RNA-directed DNA polymerase
MDDKRQKIQKELASKARLGSEASDGAIRGFESFEAIGATESPAGTEHMLEELLDRENLKEALNKVLENKGAAGIDGMTVDKLPQKHRVS